MKDIKKILVGIDFSSQSKQTFLYVSSLADKTGAELIALSVINQRDIDAASVYSRLVGKTAISVENFTKQEIERRKTGVDRVLKEIGLADIERKTVIKVGHPYEEILKAIKELDVDLVVMGTRGETTHDKYSILTGSVAERVFKHSPVPVLSFRGE